MAIQIGRKTKIIIVLSVLLAAALVGGGLTYKKYTEAQAEIGRLSDPQEVVRIENAKTVEAVGMLIELPIGETPTIATVSDKEKLKVQPFFAKAENGDKVLIYTQAKKAILYRPSANKVIDVGLVNINK